MGGMRAGGGGCEEDGGYEGRGQGDEGDGV